MKANIYISTSAIKGADVINAINDLLSISGNIELSGGSAYNRNLLEKLIALKNEESVNFLLHGYFPPPEKHFLLNFADTGERTKDFIRTSMTYVKALDIPYYSIHAGFKKDFVADENELLSEADGARAYALDDMMKNIEWFSNEFNDARIVIENMYPNNMNTDCAYHMHIDDIISFYLNFPEAYLLLDLGHLNISAGMMDFNFLDALDELFTGFSRNILEIHLSDNDGRDDLHRLIFPGSVQHEVIKRYASLINENGINLTLEARDFTVSQLSECYRLIDRALGN